MPRFHTRRILLPALLALAVMAAAAGTLLYPREGEAAVTAVTVAVAPTERFTAAQYTIDLTNDAGATLSNPQTLTIVFPIGTPVPDADIAAGALVTVNGFATDAASVTTPAAGGGTLLVVVPAAAGVIAAGAPVTVVIAVGANVRNPGTLPGPTPILTVSGSNAVGATVSAPYAPAISSTGAAAIQVDDDLVAPGSAFATIQAAHDVALAGDTINVAAGAYPEDIDITKTLTIVGAGTATTTITGQSTDAVAIFLAPVNAAVDIRADNVKLSGFTINTPGGTVALFATAILVSGIDVEILNNAITLSKGGAGITPSVGIYTIAANAFDGLSIHDNTIGDDGTGTGLGFQGIRITGQGPAVNAAKPVVVTDNVITGALVIGIESQRSSVTIGGSGNTLRTSLPFAVVGILIDNGASVIVQENIIADAGMGLFGSGIVLTGAANGVTVRSNTVSNSDFTALFIDGGAHTVTGNVFETSANGVFISTAGNTFTNNFINGNGLSGVDDGRGGVNTHNFNSITGNGFGVIASGGAGTSVNAQKNWWGNAGGPGVGGANTNVLAGGGETIDASSFLATLGMAGPGAQGTDQFASVSATLLSDMGLEPAGSGLSAQFTHSLPGAGGPSNGRVR